jgi:hypothetical protein
MLLYVLTVVLAMQYALQVQSVKNNPYFKKKKDGSVLNHFFIF